ncbi:MAG: cysteine desulfurase-like protein [Gammaproteobacteria bacterium]|nr:cysteine desulfurase-like protein [Gammaproteobacteria bacterium]MDH3362589.1 cysteine desulfurase-like protein [Gammaproteobacteria bacterium]MDH3480538.1 cysteine desulfurase-like protein [Gammaproteobacteria bacterium]
MQFDLESVRAQFPALSVADNGVRRIYFDNPAGTQVPSTVADAMSDCLLEKNANIGGYFATSVDAGQIVASARVAMADFLNAPSPDEIIFGQNMTTITFHMSRSIGRTLSPGDEIILSRMDHDANVWPWVLLAQDLGLNVKWLSFNKETFEFDPDAVDAMLTDRTRLLCVGGASNLTGTINDVANICAKARDAGAVTYIDAVQSAPHVVTDVQRIGCDFLVCSAYKFFGPHQGILWGRSELLERLEPYKVRPAPDEIPDCFETGTQNHEGVAGVAATVDYFRWIGDTMAQDHAYRWPEFSGRRQALRAAMDYLFEYERSLAERLIDGLTGIDGITVQGITAADAMLRRVPTVSFTHDSVASDAIAEALARQNIFVWSGHNYAVEVAKTLGIYDSGGAVRVGPVHYNSHREVDELLAALAEIVSR